MSQTLKSYTFAYSAKLNGRGFNGRVQAIHSTEALAKVKNENELFSNIKVRALRTGKA